MPLEIRGEISSVLERRCLSPKETEKVYGLSYRQQLRLIRSGQLHSVKIMGRRLNSVESLERLAREGAPILARGRLAQSHQIEGGR